MSHKIQSTQLYTLIRVPPLLQAHGTAAKIIAMLDVPRSAADIRANLPGHSYNAVAGALYRLRRDKCIVMHNAKRPAVSASPAILTRTGREPTLKPNSTRCRVYRYLARPKSVDEVREHFADVGYTTLLQAVNSLVLRGAITRTKEIPCLWS